MARYFFDIPDADIADPNDLVDVHDAREAGLRALAAIIRESHPDGTPNAPSNSTFVMKQADTIYTSRSHLNGGMHLVIRP